MEEIPWRWVLECPAFDISAECIVKPFFSQYLFAKYRQAQSGFFVSREAQVIRLDHVRYIHDGVHPRCKHCRGLFFNISFFIVLAVVEYFSIDLIDERIKAFVHPGIFTFVRSYDHWEPVMAKFVVRHFPQTAFATAHAAEYDARIFHTTYAAGHVGGNGVSILKPLLRIQLNTGFYIFSAA